MKKIYSLLVLLLVSFTLLHAQTMSLLGGTGAAPSNITVATSGTANSFGGPAWGSSSGTTYAITATNGNYSTSTNNCLYYGMPLPGNGTGGDNGEYVNGNCNGGAPSGGGQSWTPDITQNASGIIVYTQNASTNLPNGNTVIGRFIITFKTAGGTAIPYYWSDNKAFVAVNQEIRVNVQVQGNFNGVGPGGGGTTGSFTPLLDQFNAGHYNSTGQGGSAAGAICTSFKLNFYTAAGISLPTDPYVGTTTPSNVVCANSSANLTAWGMAPGGQSLYFNNTNNNTTTPQYATLPNTDFLNTGTGFTVESWVYINSSSYANANWIRLFDFGKGAGNNNVLLALSAGTGGVPSFQILNTAANTNSTLNSNRQFPLNAWTHIAVTYSNTGVYSMYINGISVGSITGGIAPPNILRDKNYIGLSNWSTSFGTGGDYPLYGSIDNFRVWNSPLSQTTIQGNMFLEYPSSTSGLIYNYPFNGNTISDYNTLTLVNKAPIPIANLNTFNSTAGSTPTLQNYTWTATPSGTAPSASIAQSQTTGSIPGASSITYTVVPNIPGCMATTASAGITITSAPATTISIASQANSVCAGNAATINVYGIQNSSTYNTYALTYAINGGAAQTANVTITPPSGTVTLSTATFTTPNLATGNNSLVISGMKNSLNCSTNPNVTVPISVVAAPTVTVTPAAACTPGNNGAVTVALSGGVTNVRSVRITQLSDAQALNTAEIQGIDLFTGTVIAGATGSESSDYDAVNFPASRLVNGTTGGSGEFAHTLDGVGQWQQITFPSDKNLSSVVIWDRSDCCQPRLERLRLELYSSGGTLLYTKVINGNGYTQGVSGSYGPPYLSASTPVINSTTSKWNTGATTATISSLANGTYTYTYRDALTTCTDASGSASIANPTAVLAVTATATNTCTSQSNGTVTVTGATGGTPGYTYALYNGSILSAYTTTTTYTGLTTGTYTIYVKDAQTGGGCTATSTPMTITNRPVPTPTVSTVNAICNGGGNTGKIIVTAVNGNSPNFNFSWSGTASGSVTGVTSVPTTVTSSVPTGTYTLLTTDVYGCTASTPSIVVGQNGVLTAGTVAVSSTAASCYNGTPATLSGGVPTGGSGNYTYQWQSSTASSVNGLAGSFTNVTGATANPYTPPTTLNTPTYYKVIATDATCSNSVTSTNSVMVNIYPTVPSVPVINVSPTSATSSTIGVCTGVAVTTTATGLAPSDRCLVLPSGNTTSYDNITVGSTFNGTYNFTIEGWVYPKSFQSWSRMVDIGNTVGGTGTNSFLVAISNGTSGKPDFGYNGVDMTSPVAIPLNAWTHLAAVYDGTMGYLYINGNLVVSANLGTLPNATRSLGYIGKSTWTGDALADAQFDAVRVWKTNLSASTIRDYMFRENLAGHPNVANLAVDFNFNGTNVDTLATGAPAANLVGSTSYTNTNYYTYTWSTNAGTAPTWSAGATTGTTSESVTISNTVNGSTGNYTVSAKTANNCDASSPNTKTQAIYIDPVPGISKVGTSTDTTVTGCGSVTVFPTIGTNGDLVGIYNGIPGAGGTLIGSRGTSYTLSTVTTGTYVYIVTYNSVTGCEATPGLGVGVSYTRVKLVVNASFTPSITVVNATCNGGSTGQATISSTNGGVAPFSFSWSGTGTGGTGTAAPVTRTGLAAGNYAVTINDNGGCVAVQNFAITEPSALQISSATLSSSTTGGYNINCGNSSQGTATGSINIVTAGGNAGTTYNWTSNTGYSSTIQNPSGAGVVAGTYTVVVHDGNLSCPNITATYTLTGPPVVSGQVNVGYACGATTYTSANISLSGSGGVGPYTYSNTAGTTNVYNTTSTYSPISNGNYSNYGIKDANGCVYAVPTISVTQVGTTATASDACNTIFVSNIGSGTTGTRTCPTSLVTAVTPVASGGLFDVTSRSRVVLLEGTVAAGTAYTINQVIELPSGITIEGGYTDAGTEWVRTSDHVSEIVFNGAEENPTTNVQHRIGFRAVGKTNFNLSDLKINVNAVSGQVNGYGKSVYGLYIDNCTGYKLTRLNITTGAATKGADGVNGTNGGQGYDGASGGGGNCDDDDLNDGNYSGGYGTAYNGAGGGGGTAGGGAGGAPTVYYPLGTTSAGGSGTTGTQSGNYRNGGGGGAGGAASGENNSAGYGGAGGKGANGAINGGGGGNHGTTSYSSGSFPTYNAKSSPNEDQTAGGGGTAGTDGTDAGAGAVGTFGSYFTPGALASDGTDGAGGGGGGGGGGGPGEHCAYSCTDGSGSGGGGGGGGGQGGSAGTGAKGGGSSIGIYQTSTSTGTITNCYISAGAAGAGGGGGSASIGGNPGNGGAPGSLTCQDTNRPGKAGGNGGKGGRGGKGGDGQAGYSYQIYKVGTGASNGASIVPTTNTPAVSLKQRQGCTNSIITLTKASGTFNLASMGTINSDVINDQTPSTATTSSTSSPAYVAYSTVGVRNVVVGSTTYENYINIVQARTTPTFSVTQNGLATTSPCTGSAITLTVTGSGTPIPTAYNWSIISGTSGSAPTGGNTGSTTTHTFTAAGTYYVQLEAYTECCGWTVPVYATLTVVTTPTGTGVLASSTGDWNFCPGETATISFTGITGANTYDWSLPSGATATTALIGNTSGSLTVTFGATSGNISVIPKNNCGSGTQVQQAIIANPAPAVTISNTPVSICAGGSLTVNSGVSSGTPTYVYTWSSSPAGGISGVASGSSVNTSALTVTTNYTLLVTDANGCTGTNTGTVTVLAAPIADNISATPSGTSVCAGTSLSATFAGASGGAGTITDVHEVSINGGAYAPYSGAISTTGLSGQTVTIRSSRTATGANCGTSAYKTFTWTITLPVSGTLTPTPAVGTVCEGTNVSAALAAGSGGTGTINDVLEVSLDGGAYAPYTSGTNISTTGHNTITIHTYRTATGSNCTTGSTNAVTWVIPAATIAGGATVCSSLPITLTSSYVNGSGTPFYQWQSSTDNITFTNITGANAQTYSPSTSAVGTTYYRLVITFSGNVCSATSASQTVTTNGAQTSTTWTGAVSGEWFNQLNWTNCVPGPSTVTTIPSGTPNSPNTYNSPSPVVGTVSVAAGATISIFTGVTLTASTDITNSGTITMVSGGAGSAIVLGGNLVNNSGSAFNGGNGNNSITFTDHTVNAGIPGTQNSLISGNANTIFNIINIAKTSTGKLTTATSIIAAGALNINSGIFEVGLGTTQVSKVNNATTGKIIVKSSTNLRIP